MSNDPAQTLKPGDHVFLVDGSSFVFRAYFQSINQNAKYNFRSDGLPTGAVRLFCTKLYQFIREGAVDIRPTHMAIVFDKSEDTFRKEIYEDYKAHRKEPPPDLIPQFPLMRAAVRAFGLEPVEKEGFEADDLIATYACKAEAQGADVLIISSDKDLMQIVTPRIQFYDFESGSKGKPGYRPERRIDVDGVMEYFGVPPEKVIDIQALVGDTSDNVPGVPGIGLKTAAQLLAEFGDLDTLLERAGEIKQPKRRENLLQYADQARMSRRLVTLDCDVPLEIDLPALAVPEPDPKPLIAFLKAMEFNTLTRRVAEAFESDAEEIAPDPELMAGAIPRAEGWRDSAPDAAAAAIAEAGGEAGEDGEAAAGTPGALAAKVMAEARATPCDHSNYETVRDLEALDRWIAEAREAGRVAVDTETTSLDAMAAELVGVSMATAPGRACYIPLGHRQGADDLLDGGLAPDQLPLETALERLKPLLEEPGVLKIGQNIKYDVVVLARYGIDPRPIDDTLLMSYVLDAGRGNHGMDELAARWLEHSCLSYDALTGTGKNRIGFAQVAIDKASDYAAEDADVTLRLWQVFRARLVAERMVTVYETLERPMVAVLADMERAGVNVDRQMLSQLSGDFAQTMAGLEAEIHELAGERFNLGSPKQLGDILFGKMGLPGGKKTKTGAWSTGAGALEELAAEGHELPRRILEWRQLSKLKSTYSDALPNFINHETGRVHTCFALASTTTGRLSSSEPNLQNIPVRTEAGRKIRHAFVSGNGMKLLSADYSQIELRILAHIADIPQLCRAFAEGLDIHATTASEIFGVPIEGMDPMVRRRAKAINFGIIYGISAFGLANQLGIGRQEARDYIDRYFERFPGIRDYMEDMKTRAREAGFVSTLFGRKCHYPLSEARTPAERGFLERAAINAPIQGSAADIIRRAMIRMGPALGAVTSGRMLLQVHDELVFEIPDDEVDAARPVIVEVMQMAALPAVDLAVPLEVEARAAEHWDEAH